MAGRPAKSIEQHRIDGTYRADRHGDRAKSEEPQADAVKRRVRNPEQPDSISSADTKEWIRNASDERAVRNGCVFDVLRARFAVEWIERYCRLYEGDHAGEKLELRDWALEVVMRLFGWVRYSEDFGRYVRRFREASVWVPKKNKKSPTLAAIGLYLLYGDGENGQKVYSTARDGKQAMISHTHAIEMVKRSPELMAAGQINKSTGQITDKGTTSFYKIVAGDNPKSQEGLNGSVLVDETHVVDAKLMRILKGAGISRSEPLQCEFSTAGNDPESYGKMRFDYGRSVERGEVSHEGLLFAAWAAPQDISDENLDKSIIEIGKAANPAWGHTIRESEFVESYQLAKRSISDLAEFKMYRLNVWQQSANPWLRASDWDKCKRDFTEADMQGRCCIVAALDLSRTRDMSSIVYLFEGDESDELYVLPYFWMPASRARNMNHIAPFLTWAQQGFLALTPSDVIDYELIKAQFMELFPLFRPPELVYDPRWANEITQDLQDKTAQGFERVMFIQDKASYATPTADLERLVIAGKFHHNGHPVLSWQAKHVRCRRDLDGAKRPEKPDGKTDSAKTIDGIVCCVMGLGRAIVQEKQWDGKITTVGG